MAQYIIFEITVLLLVAFDKNDFLVCLKFLYTGWNEYNNYNNSI